MSKKFIYHVNKNTMEDSIDSSERYSQDSK